MWAKHSFFHYVSVGRLSSSSVFPNLSLMHALVTVLLNSNGHTSPDKFLHSFCSQPPSYINCLPAHWYNPANSKNSWCHWTSSTVFFFSPVLEVIPIILHDSLDFILITPLSSTASSYFTSTLLFFIPNVTNENIKKNWFSTNWWGTM